MVQGDVLHYIEDAEYEMANGGCPAGFAGKAIAHLSDQSPADVVRRVRLFLIVVDQYLESYTAPVGPPHDPTLYKDQIRFWKTVERPAALRKLYNLTWN